MLDLSRDQMLRWKQIPAWDFAAAFGDLNPKRRVSSHQEIRDHYVALVAFLKRKGWDSQRIADLIGTARQTSYQYGFKPETRGSRIIPADKLDRLRDAATAIRIERMEAGFPAFLNRDEHLWLVFAADMSLLLETTSPWRAAWHAAMHGGTAVYGKDNVLHGDDKLSDNDRLCIEWLEIRHGGLVDKKDAMCAAGCDEYLVERIAHEYGGWRIQPTVAQVEALRSLAMGRLSRAT
ncbi:hypothetical protein [Mesorhizobium sp. A623]